MESKEEIFNTVNSAEKVNHRPTYISILFKVREKYGLDLFYFYN